GAQQEVPRQRVKLGQDLLGQVVADVSSIARERSHAFAGIVVTSKPQRRQTQPCGPSLGTLSQQLENFTGQGDSFTGEQFASFVDGEGQVAGADLLESSGGPQPREADCRV